MSAHHALVIVDRGAGHVHRWKPSCSCGWVGCQRRRKAEAVKQYRTHQVVVHAATASAKRSFKPRRPTPAAELPMALAPSVVSFS